jgi:16S rRNA (cytosine967-C5)-methyltransferase
MWLRVNVRRTSPEAYMQLLENHGVRVRTALGAAILLETPCAVHELPGFDEGLVSVQDLGAQLAALILAPGPGMRTLDACAAPGGKTGHLLERFDTALTALDSDPVRLEKVRHNLKRLGLQARLCSADAAKVSAWWDGVPYDRILLDVPCSGSGVVRRHPDIKWIRRESDISSFVHQQIMLLDSLWRCLSNGGRLLYATCSTFHAENLGVIEQFVLQRTDVRQLAVSDGAASEFKHPGQDGTPTLQCINGQLVPDQAHDGFFYALLEKIG